MKALITAAAMMILMTAPSFAQFYGYQPPAGDSSPASPNYGSNGY
jgi:hypothetical protein